MVQYRVRAVPWEHGFELHITGPDGFEGCTQCLGTWDAVDMARDYIRLDTGLPAREIGIQFVMDLAEEK